MKTRRLCLITQLSLVAALLAATPLVAVPVDFGAGYRESWDSYTSQADATLNSVWNIQSFSAAGSGQITLGGAAFLNLQLSGSPISTPNYIALDNRNRISTNSLTDGITNGVSTELSAGQVIKPDATAALNTTNDLYNYDNLQLRMLWNSQSGTARKNTSIYSELSYGNIHAPALTDSLDPLTEAIPLIAIGKLNGNYTGVIGNAQNNSIYFFNGLQWVRLSNMAANTTGNNYIDAKIYYDPNDSQWKAYVQFLANSGDPTSINTTVALQFDPTVLGFNTASMVMGNSGVSPSGKADDVWVAGGLVVPEPSTLVLLIGGCVALLRKRTR